MKEQSMSAKHLLFRESAREKILKGASALADEIRVRAYQKWEAAGGPKGDGVEFWLQAERELQAN
jgi:hypothetical protein